MKKSTRGKSLKVTVEKDKLKLNVVTFEADKKPIKLAFYYSPAQSSSGLKLHKLNKHHLPSEYNGQNKENPHPLYTTFSDHKNAPVRITIDPSETNPLFMKAFYLQMVLNYFRTEHSKLVINHDFINRPEIWLPVHDEDQPGHSMKRFHRHGLCMHVGYYTADRPELLVSYRGRTDVLGKNLSNYQDDLDEVNRVVNQIPEAVKYSTVIETDGHNLQDYYPVVNRHFREKYGLPNHYIRVKNKFKQASIKVSSFYQNYIDNDAFKEITGLKAAGFFTPDKTDINRVAISNHQMIFGGGKTEEDAFQGLKKYGPWRSASVKKPRILLISPAGKQHQAYQKLIKPFLEGTGPYPGASRMAGLPLKVLKTPILYTNYKNPFPEIQKQLLRYPFQQGEAVLAFFFSTISKHEPNLQIKKNFYRVKEELMKNGIPSQGINLKKFERAAHSDISWWHQHLCSAVLAKLGGIPWKAGSDQAKDLIIGVGAFKPGWSPHRYVGSSFCFDNSGLFRGYDFFDHSNTKLLAGSIKKALQQYVREHGDAERVVIHYFKDMSYEDAQPIWKAIHDLKRDIPIYLVSINKTRDHDEVVTYKKTDGRMPLSGTYIHLSHNRYLLFNNIQMSEDITPKKYPFPIKLQIRELWDDDKREQMNALSIEERREQSRIADNVVHELMSQIIRFSRMYWKSLNPQPLPVTIVYPALLAEQVPYFDRPRIPAPFKHLPFFL